MPSPFPGMDPYIEQSGIWPDFHHNLAAQIRTQLNPLLGSGYVARSIPYVAIPLELPVRLNRIEVRKIDTDELVTVIEILSPVNKRPGKEAREEYLRKRRDLLRSVVHLIEIDLLRDGQRPPIEHPVPPAPYCAVVSRSERRPTVDVWPIQLWDRLPVLPVPLREPDPDVPLELGASVAAVYEGGAYERQIDYSQSPPPPALTEQEAQWWEERRRAAK